MCSHKKKTTGCFIMYYDWSLETNLPTELFWIRVLQCGYFCFCWVFIGLNFLWFTIFLAFTTKIFYPSFYWVMCLHKSLQKWPCLSSCFALLLLHWSRRRLSDLLKGTEHNSCKVREHYSFISLQGLLASEKFQIFQMTDGTSLSSCTGNIFIWFDIDSPATLLE